MLYYIYRRCEMSHYESVIKNAFAEHDQEFLLDLKRYAADYEEEEIERLMYELDICPNCASDIEVVCENETHGFTAYDPLVEKICFKKCSTCGWE
jgi:hypothetical protein